MPSSQLSPAPGAGHQGEQETNIRWSVKLSPVKLMKYIRTLRLNIKSSFFLMFSPSLPGELQLTYHTSIYIIRLMKLLIIINLEELTIIPFLVLMK